MKDKLANEFQEFWSNSAGKVKAYMLCACRNISDAEDMTQDCCLRALNAWNQFAGKGSRQAWLFGIAKRTRIDWLRRKIRDNARVEEQKSNYCKETCIENSEIHEPEKIWDAVKDLNEEHSEVIHLKFAAGLSYSQIAQTLEIPVGTVRSRLHRGLKAIKEIVGDFKNES